MLLLSRSGPSYDFVKAACQWIDIWSGRGASQSFTPAVAKDEPKPNDALISEHWDVKIKGVGNEPEDGCLRMIEKQEDLAKLYHAFSAKGIRVAALAPQPMMVDVFDAKHNGKQDTVTLRAYIRVIEGAPLVNKKLVKEAKLGSLDWSGYCGCLSPRNHIH